MKLWLLFATGTILCWGAYVPTIHHGQMAFEGKNKALWAFLFVGVAYFLVAVLVPAGYLVSSKAPSQLGNVPGMRTSMIAGVLGALGALFIILAIKEGAKPLYVAPIVFCGAPIVNTFVSLIWKKLADPSAPLGSFHPLFFIGILLAAGGASLVLLYKPS